MRPHQLPSKDQQGETLTSNQWLDPTPEMLQDPRFEAIWQVIKTWDINVPHVYRGYCGATGNHVRAILDALSGTSAVETPVIHGPCPQCGTEWTSERIMTPVPCKCRSSENGPEKHG